MDYNALYLDDLVIWKNVYKRNFYESSIILAGIVHGLWKIDCKFVASNDCTIYVYQTFHVWNQWLTFISHIPGVSNLYQ